MNNQKPTDCDSCIHNVVDDNSYDAYCDLCLDEDECQKYAFLPNYRCPFYQYKDEYINVRKQI